MRIAREEIFGPVLSVIAYEDEGGPEGLADWGNGLVAIRR
jgi:acyl-CoA reductase-like NAD-dependent aldehyde dehydrogenase